MMALIERHPMLGLASVGGLFILGCVLEVILHHDHPVFSREDNLRFRVWHDTAHLEHGLGFSDEEEVQLFREQARMIGRPGQSTAVVDALFCESVYQLAWCRVHGRYPGRQVVRTPGPVALGILDAWGLNG